MTSTDMIRGIIASARQHEENTGHLRQLIEGELNVLHRAIRLPEDRPAQALLNFAIRYIEHVPNFVDAITGLTRSAGVYDYAGIFLNIASNYFVDPPDLVRDHQGLHALMDEAYLAHRLIEELNDRIVSRCGVPLAPMDMTYSNLIAFELIREPIANELDFAVHYAIEMHADKETLIENDAFKAYVRDHKQKGWLVELDQWPCLAENLNIDVSFGFTQ